MRSYETARSLYSFLGFCATAVIILGVIVAFMGGAATQALSRNAGAMQFIMGALPGLLIAMAGAYGQAMVQMGRTSVDTAEYAQQSLEVSRQQLEISRQALAQGKAMAASYASAQVATPAAAARQDAVEPEVTYADAPKAGPVEDPDVLQSGSSPETLETNAPALKQISYKDGLFHLGAMSFRTEEAAQRYADQLGVNLEANQRRLPNGSS